MSNFIVMFLTTMLAFCMVDMFEDVYKRQLYVSRPYLSKKFRESTGETLTDFILKEKTEEAKRCLLYTSYTLL